jgi:RNA polymerase sigma factor (sigma-70 family)
VEEPTKQGASSLESVLKRIAAGSDEAVWELLDRYHSNILRLVRRRLPKEIRAKVDSVDIVQSVWKSIFRGGQQLRETATAEDVFAYLAGMARLKILEAHRRFTRYPGYDVRREVPFTRSATEQAVHTNNFPSAIVRARENWERAMSQSGELGHKAIQLKLQGLTLDEMAEQLQVSKSTVQRLLRSVLQSLEA